MRKLGFLLLFIVVLSGLSGCDKEEEVKTLFERYRELDIATERIHLEKRTDDPDYYCYPVNAKAIGFEGCIMYCFIDGYDEMVFASNPENYGDDGQVYPLARNFEDFLRLVVACGSANPVEQIIHMTREGFENHLHTEWKYDFDIKEREAVLDTIRKELGITPMEDPYTYVKEVQKDFDDSKIIYSDAYYESQGLNRDGTPREIWVNSTDVVRLELSAEEG